MANGTPESLTQEQANRVLEAETFAEKRKIASELGFSDEILDQLDPSVRARESLRAAEAEKAGGSPREGAKTSPVASPDTSEEVVGGVSRPVRDGQGVTTSSGGVMGAVSRPLEGGEGVVSGSVRQIEEEEEGDVPIETVVNLPEMEEEDSIIDWSRSVEEAEPRNDELEELRLVQSSIIQNYLDGTPLIEGYLQYRGTRDKGSVRDALADVKKNEDLKATRELFLEDPSVTEADIMSEAEITKLMELQIEEEATGPMKPHNAYADAIAQGNIEEAAKMQLAMNSLLYEELVKPMAEDVTLWDQVKTFTVDMIPGGQLYRNEQVTNHFFGAQESLRDLAARFSTLPPEKKRVVFPALRDRLVEEVGETRAVGLLTQFLSPEGDMGFDEFSNAWATVDAVDAATVVGGIATSIAKLGRSVKAIGALKEGQRADDAADISAISAVDETGETARASGISRMTAHENAVPFNVTELDPQYTDGLSTKIQERIRGFAAKREESLRGIALGTSWKRERPPLTPEEAENLALDGALQREGIENAQIVNRTDEGFELKYDVVRQVQARDQTGRFVRGKVPEKVRTERLPIKYDRESGELWEPDDRGWTRLFLESNTSIAGQGNMAKDVNKALRLDSSGAKVTSDLMKLQREALKPVVGSIFSGPKRDPFLGGRRSVAKLDQVLKHGDKESKVFNTHELMELGLNDREMEAYFNLRNLYDGLFDLRNFEVRRDFVKRGFKNVTTRKGDDVIAQPYNDSGAAKRALGQPDFESEYTLVDDLDEIRRTDDLDLDELYREGYRLAKAQDGIMTEGAGKVRTVLVRQDQISDLPQRVLQYKQGYVPRVYRNGAYFVKSVKPTKVDGKVLDLDNPKTAISRGATTETLRIFDNKPDAEKWARQRQDELGSDATDRTVVLEDREIEKQGGASVFYGSGGGPGNGLYTGARGEDAIPFGMEGAEAPTIGAFEALSQNIQNISNFVSRNELRRHWQQKWINTARGLDLPVQNYGEIPAGVNAETAAYLNKMREAVDTWSGVPSSSERFMESATQKLIDNIAGKKVIGGQRTRNMLHNLKHKDPVAAARAAAFHSLLGWFNPVQWWVQAQGATLALSANLLRPDRMTKVLAQQSALAATDFVENTQYISDVASKFNMSPDNFLKMRELWQKTGYRDSILNTADHAAAMQSYGIGSDALRRASSQGLMFYKMGELFNRRVSFLSALDEYRAATGKKITSLNDDDLGEIMTRANDFMLNLSRSNKARWQQGILSLPTQFMQVNTKLIETIIGTNKRMSKADRYKIAAGQFGLYGFAGVPFGTAAWSGIAGVMGIDEADQAEASDDIKRLANGGMTDWIAFNMFNADVDVANRSTIAQGIEDFLIGMVTDTTNTITNVPFLSVAGRAYSAMKHGMVLAGPALEDGEMPNLDVAMATISEVGKITSSWSQTSKAIHMHRWGELLDRNRRAIVEKDFSIETEIATAIGFKPRESNVTYELEAMNRANKRYRSDLATEIVFLMDKYASAVGDKNYEDVDESVRKYYEQAIRLRYSLARNENEEQAIRNSVSERIQKGNDRYSRALKQWIGNRANEESARLYEFGAELQARPFEVTIPNKEDE